MRTHKVTAFKITPSYDYLFPAARATHTRIPTGPTHRPPLSLPPGTHAVVAV